MIHYTQTHTHIQNINDETILRALFLLIYYK